MTDQDRLRLVEGRDDGDHQPWNRIGGERFPTSDDDHESAAATDSFCQVRDPSQDRRRVLLPLWHDQCQLSARVLLNLARKGPKGLYD